MKRRDFLRTAGTVTTGLSLGLVPLQELWAKFPSRIKITGIKSLIVEDEVYLKVLTSQGIVGEGHTTVHRKAKTCQAAVQDLERVLYANRQDKRMADGILFKKW